MPQHDLHKWEKGQSIMWNAANKLLNLIFDQCRKSSEDVATTADALDMFGCKKEADMLRCKLVLC